MYVYASALKTLYSNCSYFMPLVLWLISYNAFHEPFPNYAWCAYTLPICTCVHKIATAALLEYPP